MEALIDDLKETGEYQFRVTAVNKAGLSPPSDPSKTQVIRHKALKPRIDRTNLITIIVRAGKPIFFDVDVRGEPPPEITVSTPKMISFSKCNDDLIVPSTINKKRCVILIVQFLNFSISISKSVVDKRSRN